MEVKWWRTRVTTWPDARALSFVDQIERHYIHWRDTQLFDPHVRLVWLFVWNPPITAVHILEKNETYDFPRITGRAAEQVIYPAVPYVEPTAALADLIQPTPWMAGPIYWTTFIPSDFRFIRGVFDEAPCFPCSEHPGMCEAGGLVDNWVEVTAHTPSCRTRGRGIFCDFLDIEATVIRIGSVYINQRNLLRWLGIYQHACIHGHAAGCNPWLSKLYDRLKCRGVSPLALRPPAQGN